MSGADSNPKTQGRMGWFPYLTVFVAGAVVLVLEILGTRILAPFYGSTIFVWSSMIIVTLGSLAVGYLVGGVVADRSPDGKVLGMVLCVAGLAVALLTAVDRPVLLWSDRFGLRAGPLVASGLLFGLPLLLLGMVTPFAIRLHTARPEVIGRGAGTMFALGTAGSLVGALLAGYYLLPRVPLSGIFLASAGLLVGLGALGLMRFGRRQAPGSTVAPAALLVLAVVTLMLPGAFMRGQIRSERILAHQQSVYGDLKVVRVGPYRCLYVDAGAQSCLTDDMTTDSRYIQALETLIAQANPRRILMLGLGAGAALSVIPSEQIEVDAVELDPDVVALAERFRLMPPHRAQVHYDDARRFLRKTTETYDLVVLDVARGNNIPSYMLTREAFADMERVLTDDGQVLIHLSLTPEGPDDPFLTSVARTLEEVFGSYGELSVSARDLRDVNFVAPAPGTAAVEPFVVTRQLEVARGTVVSDEFNPLDAYYTPYALEFRDAVGALGEEIYLVN